jgi:hypothetical protein
MVKKVPDLRTFIYVYIAIVRHSNSRFSQTFSKLTAHGRMIQFCVDII